jgi:hypothetical protein
MSRDTDRLDAAPAQVMTVQQIVHPKRSAPSQTQGLRDNAFALGENALAGNLGCGAQRGIEHPFAPVNFLAQVQDR